MYLSILALPLLGSIIAGVFGRKLGVTGAQWISTICLISSAILALVGFYEVVLCNSPVSINLGSWFLIELLEVNWTFYFDSLTISILLAVLIVSALVHLFSIDYIANDPHVQRFFSYLSFFTFAMLILVTGDNYAILFLGWEGIGVASFLLISFWYTRLQANKAGIQAILVNRVGDIFFTLGFFVLFIGIGNLDYASLFSISSYINETVLTIVGLLFLFAAIGKSANIPLHTWLPSAIEGPTPVSALIHAATLVTAGVYLLIRSSPILEFAPTALLVIAWVGATTAFFAATIGLFQNDLKRIIAYSTCSQIGYLFLAVGLSQYNVAVFHLVAHAYFKALLFLAAGGVLHSIADQQDIRKLGGLSNYLPFTYTAILVGSLSLIAIPFLSGFYTKDLILELAASQMTMSGNYGYWLGTITAGLTAYYSFRLVSLTFGTVPNAPKNDYLNSHEQPIIVIIPYLILGILSIVFGWFAKDIFVGVGSDALSTSLFQNSLHINIIEAEFNLSLFYKLLPAILTFAGAMLSYYLYHYMPYFLTLVNGNEKNNGVSWFLNFIKFFNGKWFVDIVYNNYIINPSLNFGSFTSKIADKGIIEKLGPFGLTESMYSFSHSLSLIDTGHIVTYALYIILYIAILVMFVIFSVNEIFLALLLVIASYIILSNKI
jgi:NADH-ubiquinone oxidoreductase chain 5